MTDGQNPATPEMIDEAEANIRSDFRRGTISKEQFQKEMMIMARARHQALTPPPVSISVGGIAAIAAERQRQIDAGYDANHDDGHRAGEIISAPWGARARIEAAIDAGRGGDVGAYKKFLTEAAAQCAAEIERVERAEGKDNG
jgi:hypothetical protein